MSVFLSKRDLIMFLYSIDTWLSSLFDCTPKFYPRIFSSHSHHHSSFLLFQLSRLRGIYSHLLKVGGNITQGKQIPWKSPCFTGASTASWLGTQPWCQTAFLNHAFLTSLSRSDFICKMGTIRASPSRYADEY